MKQGSAAAEASSGVTLHSTVIFKTGIYHRYWTSAPLAVNTASSCRERAEGTEPDVRLSTGLILILESVYEGGGRAQLYLMETHRAREVKKHLYL